MKRMFGKIIAISLASILSLGALGFTARAEIERGLFATENMVLVSENIEYLDNGITLGYNYT